MKLKQLEKLLLASEKDCSLHENLITHSGIIKRQKVTLILERLKELVSKQAKKRGLVRYTPPKLVKI